MDDSVQPNTSPAQWPGKAAQPNTFYALINRPTAYFSYCQQVKTQTNNVFVPHSPTSLVQAQFVSTVNC